MITADLTNLTAVLHQVGREDHRSRFGHDGGVLWLTGLSGSGKSTLAMGLERRLHSLGFACYTLDGDNVRHGLSANLGFSPEDRSENIRRVGEVAALFADAGLICITAFISPYCSDRANARAAAGRTGFHEIHVAADIETCESRDPKGLYRQVRNGTLRSFTGIDAPYEIPNSPELIIDTNAESVGQSLQRIVDYAVAHFPLDQPSRVAPRCSPS